MQAVLDVKIEMSKTRQCFLKTELLVNSVIKIILLQFPRGLIGVFSKVSKTHAHTHTLTIW